MIISKPLHSYGGSQGHVSFCLCPLSCIGGRKWHYTTLLFKGAEQQKEAESQKSTSPEKETRLRCVLGSTRHPERWLKKKRRTGRLMCHGSDSYTKSMVLIFGPKQQYVNVPIRAWRGKISACQRDEKEWERWSCQRVRTQSQTLALKPGAPTREKKKDEKKKQTTTPGHVVLHTWGIGYALTDRYASNRQSVKV